MDFSKMNIGEVPEKSLKDAVVTFRRLENGAGAKLIPMVDGVDIPYVQAASLSYTVQRGATVALVIYLPNGVVVE
jgi:hypothetical protein